MLAERAGRHQNPGRAEGLPAGATFQNMRLEYHPELAGTPYVVSPGLLGRQYLHQRGWI